MFIKLLRYNNFANNEHVQVLNHIDEYTPYEIAPYNTSINFNPNDGINTSIIIHWDAATPDYLVTYEGITQAVNSRWFVIDAFRTRGGQYNLTLLRDVLSDNWSNFLQSKLYLERGFVPDNNPLIFNREDFSANEIKNYEYLVKNKAKTPWIVVYLARTDGEGNGMEYSLSWKDALTTDIYTCEWKYKFTTGETKTITEGVPYEIIAFPYGDIKIIYQDNVPQSFNTIKKTNIFIEQLIAKYGKTAIYDIQLLPYVPSELDKTTTDSQGKIMLDFRDVEPYKFIKVTFPGIPPGERVLNLLGVMVSSSSFTMDLNATMPVITSKKESVNLDRYRLVSPNGIGEYEWSPAMDESLHDIILNVDCTLKPINPYIKISPKFKNTGLYGGDYNDYRGLICSGDFSLPMASSEWLAYQQNNKNYQQMFDRNIETQDAQRDIQRTQQIIGAVTGTATGAASGAVAGGMLGGPVGAAVGAVGGGIASAVGGAADVYMSEKSYKLNRENSIAQYNMGLQNVKARAMSLTKTTSYNINNKYFPYIEYYTCTNEEKTAFNNYIAYYSYKLGITVDGTLQSYLNPSETTYIKGELLKCNIKDDSHMLKALQNIISGGIRINPHNPPIPLSVESVEGVEL